MPKIPIALLSAALMLFAGLARGQWGDDPRWYKVELMVFSHERADAESEQWEPTPALRYPDRFRFLVEPDRVRANRASNPGESSLDPFGRQLITLPESSGAASKPAPTSPVGGPDGGGTAASDAPGPGGSAEPEGRPATPTPFVTLPAGERTFPAAYMRRSGRYKPLFHQAWYQPVADEKQALPIVIDRSGDTGDWPPLQGSVKLYLSRYLHIETNLWLNTDGRYLPGQWRMPAPPLGPPSLIVEAPEPPQPAYPRGPAPAATSTAWSPAGSASDALDPNQPGYDSGPQYPFRHAVLIQQKRRMRSTEVHYLDHPLLGVVVTLTPLSEEELEALALAETGRASAAGSTGYD